MTRPRYAPCPADHLPVTTKPKVPPAHEVDEVLNAGLDAHDRGEDVGAAMRAVQDRLYPPEPTPTLDSLAIARINADGWTPDRQRAFLRHLATHGCVSHACAHVGLSKQSVYQLRDRHPTSVFAIAWDVAARTGRRRLLDEATARALDGREVAVWYRGEEVGTRTVHNDRLLMFLIAHKAEPAHPVLDDRQLAELWPAMLAQVDAVLPPSLTPERLAELAGQGAENGNDRR